MTRLLRAGTLTLITALFVGCDGGGTSVAEGGIGGTGVVSGFGSVYVNGVKYETGGDTEFLVNGTPGVETDLQVGMVVRVTGRIGADRTQGVAERIETTRQLLGPVSVNTVTADGMLAVLGQRVRTSGETLFISDSLSLLEELQPGDSVEVSGFVGEGTVHATRVVHVPDPAASEVAGFVRAHVAGLQFEIGDLTVNYSEVTILPAELEEGDFVLVSGAVSGTRMDAGTIERIELGGEPGTEVEVEGFVTTAYAAALGTFAVNGQPVRLEAGTDLHGHDATELVADPPLPVSVHGELAADGLTVLASEVEFRKEAQFEITGAVQGMPAADSFNVLGLDLRITARTIYRDESAYGERKFRFSDLRAGDQVEAHFYRDDSGSFIVTRLEREEGSETELKGEVTAKSGDRIEVFDIPVGFTPGTSFEGYADLSGFMSAVQVGDVVEVEGTWSGVGLLADDVEIED